MANAITLARFPLLFVYVALLYSGRRSLLLIGLGLLLLVYLLDSVDGWVARKTHTATLLGSVLDIAADRTVETVLWVVFAHLQSIPVLIPLILITRSSLVDAVRAVAVGRKVPPLEHAAGAVGRFVTGSRWVRFGYSAVKILAFVLLDLELWSRAGGDLPAWNLHAAQGLAWTAVAISLARGLPVLMLGPSLAKSTPPSP